MTARQYVYKIVEIVKVTDGDTYWLRVDVGFRALVLINVRLHGYDTPEAHRGTTYEKAKAVEARNLAIAWFDANKGSIWIETMKDPDSGRWLGSIWADEADDSFDYLLGVALVGENLASYWPARWRDEYDTGRATEL